MTIIKESVISLEDWKARVVGRVFRTLILFSRGGLEVYELGKFSVFADHKDSIKGKIVICPPEGRVLTKMSVTINNPDSSIIRITPSRAGNGFILYLNSGDRVVVSN